MSRRCVGGQMYLARYAIRTQGLQVPITTPGRLVPLYYSYILALEPKVVLRLDSGPHYIHM